MFKNILFAIFPKPFWLALLVAIIFSLLGGIMMSPFYFITNFLIFYAGLKLGIIFHESGHLLFTKLVGGTPRRMILGKGHKVFQTEVCGVKIILNSNFNSGLAYAAFDNLRLIKTKLFLYNAGGIIINFLIAIALFFIEGFDFDLTSGIKLGTVVGMPNLLLGAFSLIPYTINFQGMKHHTDGMSLLKIPFYKKEELIELNSVNELLDAFDLMEAKRYTESIKAYENFQSKAIESKGVNLNLSIAYLKLGNFQKAAELLEELIPHAEVEAFSRMRFLIYNALGWTYLLQNKIEEADKYSLLSYQLAPDNEYIRGTRGAVLVEKGELQEGFTLLTEDLDFNFPNSRTLTAAIFVSIALTENGEHEKVEQYLNFLNNNLDKLEADEKFLYDRAMKKIEALKESVG